MGGAEVTEFGGEPEPERRLLALGREFLVAKSVTSGPCSIADVINSLLLKQGVIKV